MIPALAAVWLFGLLFAFLSPPCYVLLVAFGSLLYTAGFWWVTYIAFCEDGKMGLLCFFTGLFAIVYVVMNPESTWKPAVLMVFGFLMTVSGYAAGFLTGAL